MEDPNGIAGGIADTFHKFITGDSFVQGMKDMWARHVSAPAPSGHDKAVSDMNKQAMDKSVQDANASHAAAMSAQQAAEIRKKAAK